MIVALLIAEVFLVGLIVGFRLLWLQLATEARYVQAKGLQVDEGKWPRVHARLRRLSTFVATSAIGGSLITSGIAAVVSREGTMEALVAPISGVIGGAVVGACAWLLSDAKRDSTAEDRPTGARLTDYVSPAFLTIAFAGLLIAIGVLITAVIVSGRFAYDPTEGYYLAPWTPALPLLAIVAGWITLLGTSVLVVRQRQSSSVTAWDDALRSHVVVLGIIQLASIQITLSPMWITTITQFALPFHSTLIIFGVTAGLLAAVYIVAALVDRKPERQFLRRLWPELATRADEVAAASKQARRDSLLAQHQGRGA